MNLNQIKKDIDKVVEDYKDTWNDHNKFSSREPKEALRLAMAFRQAQVYRAMFWMSRIDIAGLDIKNPVVSPNKGRLIPEDLVGLNLIFIWEYGVPEDENYVKIKFDIASEGTSWISTHYGGEFWTNTVERINSCHIADIGSLLREETEKREQKTEKLTE